MTELLPTLQARRLEQGLLDYLTTTFALADPEVKDALAAFLKDPQRGIFRGPYVRLRLPFVAADPGWEELLDWQPPFPPYRHQAHAYARLTTKDLGSTDPTTGVVKQRPQPTIVTTGTGSGKTEAFLYPVLDHALRARRAGQDGLKALILYPMNALATDQADRLQQLIVADPTLHGTVTAGIYTGAENGKRYTVTDKGLINNREEIRENPPDILLTNYKMLDQLLLRPADQNIWAKSAQSLTYLVLDEFHTYDGAQGTDVAMLLRRLGLALRAHLPAEHPDHAWFGRQPLGRVTPVATSATLGDGADASVMLQFAQTIFGEEFTPDAAITEHRQPASEWAATAKSGAGQPVPLASLLAETRTDLVRLVDRARSGQQLTISVMNKIFPGHNSGTAVGELLKRHPDVLTLVENAQQATDLATLTETVIPGGGQDESALAVVAALLAVMSHARAGIDGVPDRGAVAVEVTSWIRAVTRLDRAASAEPSFRWTDDVAPATEPKLPHLPAVYCRACGRSGWMVRLEPTGNRLTDQDDHIRRDHQNPWGGRGRTRALLHAPGEGAAALAADGTPAASVAPTLRWFHVKDRIILTRAPSKDDPDLLEGHILPVLMDPDDAPGGKDHCPSCNVDDRIRFIGSAVATLMSVATSSLFGDGDLSLAEKRALVFTDSVQDAAHRAGFIGARSHQMSLRSALRTGLVDGTDLTEWVSATLRAAEDSPFDRYRLVPSALADVKLFREFWSAPTWSKVPSSTRTAVRKRLELDVALEVGLQSTFGRTLEATGAIAVQVGLGSEQTLMQAAQAARGADEAAALPGMGADRVELVRWVRGVAEHIRREGGIDHPWFAKFKQEGGSRWRIWGGRDDRNRGNPAFPPERTAPSFPMVGPQIKHSLLAPVTSANSWYAQWTAKCLQVDSRTGAALAKNLLAEMANRGWLSTTPTSAAGGAGVVYGIPPENVLVRIPTEADLKQRSRLACDHCRAQFPTTAETFQQLVGGTCLTHRCRGTLNGEAVDADNFYRALYATDMHRVIAAEHTSLLSDADRRKVEEGFKRPEQEPGDPNVLVATPTLEMGIDIGDLSTVMLSGLPDSVAKYLQRVGRAGRRSGSSLNLAFVPAQVAQLSALAEPTSFINGAVRTPATYLDAEEILRRQYVAYVADELARTTRRDGAPLEYRFAWEVLESTAPDSYLERLVAHNAAYVAELLQQFVSCFPDPESQRWDALREWATASDPGNSFAALVYRAGQEYRTEIEGYAHQRKLLQEAVNTLRDLSEGPAATEENKAALRQAKGAHRAIIRQLENTREEFWVAALEKYGLLPNYTLLDDTVRLEAQVFWTDPESGEYETEPHQVNRASARALREFAPGNHFYAHGLDMTIKGVEFGQDPTPQRWALCNACGYTADLEPTGGSAPAQCPRCLSPGIQDLGHHFDAVPLKRVFSEVRRDGDHIGDDAEDRVNIRYETVALPDFDPSRLVRTWSEAAVGLSVNHYRRLRMRWANLGLVGTDQRLTLASYDFAAATFRLCEECGTLDTRAGQNSAREHRVWCSHRTDQDEHVRSVILTREMHTEALVLSLPNSLTADQMVMPSLMAAVRLGMREVMGGDPNHLALESVAFPVPGGDAGQTRQAILVHDVVPGGTGYLAQLADPDRLRAALQSAHDYLAACECQRENRACCHRCLQPFTPSNSRDMVFRSVALRALSALLGQAPWIPAEQALAPDSGESPLELRFRKALSDRVQQDGFVQEKPSLTGTRLHLSGMGGNRRWILTPQQDMHGSRPDFLLEAGGVPPVAIFTDGWTFHASPTHNVLADDATKRDRLRSEGIRVLGVTQHDIDSPQSPFWINNEWIATLRSKGVGISTAIVDEHRLGPVEVLAGYLARPDDSAREALADALPLVLIPQSVAIAAGDDLSAHALALLHGVEPAIGHTGLVYRESHLVMVSRMAGDRPVEIMLLLDDTPEAVADSAHPEAWRHWLQLSNALLGATIPVTITTTRRVQREAVGGQLPRQTTSSPSEVWPDLADILNAGQETELAKELYAAGVPAPEVGIESGQGIPLDLAWPTVKVAVLMDADPDSLSDIREEGWTVVEPRADSIQEALKHKGI